MLSSRYDARRTRAELIPVTRAWPFAAVALLATLLRTPAALIGGRFWAEEATIFAADLFPRSLPEALTYIYKGTTVLLTTLPIWAALQLPLAWAPQLTGLVAFAVELVVAAQFAAWARAAGVPLVTALVGWAGFLLLPSYYEVGATATNIQWTCSLSCLLLLLSEPERLRSRMAAKAAWVALCGLTGVPSCMLAPLFLVRGVSGGSRSHVLIGIVLCATALVQAALLLTHPLGEQRDLLLSPYLFGIVASAQTIWAPFAGLPVSARLGNVALAGGSRGYLIGVVVLCGGIGTAVLAIRLALQAGASRWQVGLPAAAWLGVTALNVFGALGDHASLVEIGGRYFVVGSLCLVMLLCLGGRAPGYGRFPPAALAWLLAVALGQRAVSDRLTMWETGPSWRAQLRQCRERQPQDYCRVRVWPGKDQMWTVDVPAERLR